MHDRRAGAAAAAKESDPVILCALDSGLPRIAWAFEAFRKPETRPGNAQILFSGNPIGASLLSAVVVEEQVNR
jgi:hypothetical protein